jgi:hypothetical protein
MAETVGSHSETHKVRFQEEIDEPLLSLGERLRKDGNQRHTRINETRWFSA